LTVECTDKDCAISQVVKWRQSSGVRSAEAQHGSGFHPSDSWRPTGKWGEENWWKKVWQMCRWIQCR